MGTDVKDLLGYNNPLGVHLHRDLGRVVGVADADFGALLKAAL
jgi:hypothetical protein